MIDCDWTIQYFTAVKRCLPDLSLLFTTIYSLLVLTSKIHNWIRQYDGNEEGGARSWKWWHNTKEEGRGKGQQGYNCWTESDGWENERRWWFWWFEYNAQATIYLLGLSPTLYLLVQLAAIFLAYLTGDFLSHCNHHHHNHHRRCNALSPSSWLSPGSSKLVWLVAISYILLLNKWPLNNIKDHIFNTDDLQM